MNFKNFWIFSFFLLSTSCSLFETPDLPDINRESFSYADVVKRKDALIARRVEDSQTKEINKETGNEKQKQQ